MGLSAASGRFTIFALTLAAATAARAGVIDVVFYDDRFGAIDSSTGAYTGISTLPIAKAAGIAVDNGETYVADLSGNLLEVNPVTGSSNSIGNNGLGLNFVVFAGGNSGLYGIDYQSNLYSFNPVNGAATLIGPTGLAPNDGYDDTSLSFDGNSLLYTAGLPGHADELYRINIVTGVATELGSTGVTAIAGSAFSNGSLDLFQYGQSANYLYTAPDGATDFAPETVLGATIVDGGVPESVATDITATPEPRSVIVFGCGLMVIALFVRWCHATRNSGS